MRDRQRELADERMARLALYGHRARTSRHLVEVRRGPLRDELGRQVRVAGVLVAVDDRVPPGLALLLQRR